MKLSDLTSLFGRQKREGRQGIELCTNTKKKSFSNQHQTSKNINIVIVGESPNNLKQELLRPLCEIAQHLNNSVSMAILTHNIHIQNQTIKLQICDTPSQQRFMSGMQVYYKTANAILVIYDVMDQESFKGAQSWIKNVKEKAPQNIPLLLVACCRNTESNPIVSQECGKKLADRHGIKYLECSMSEKSTQKIFTAAAKLALQINTPQAELSQRY